MSSRVSSKKRKYAGSYATHSASKKTMHVNKKMLQAVMKKGMETKYLDTAVGVTDPTNAGDVFTLSNVGEGTDFNTRIGRKIAPKYLQYRLQFQTGAGSAALPVQWCAHFVLDRQPNNATPTYATVFDTSVSAATYAMKNVANYQERFKILKDHRGYVSTSISSETCFVEGYIDLSREENVMYLSSAAAVPSVNCYNVYFSQGGVANAVNVVGTVRFAYTDV